MAGGQLQWRDEDNNPVLNIEQIRSIIRDTVLGLEYLHFQGIIHRDIKPANLLLNHDHQVKISDFGVSHLSKVDEETGQLLPENELELSKTAGSPAFFAPEICQTTSSADGYHQPITQAIDVWALGITLHCLLFGRTPFPETGGEFQLLDMICNDPIPILPPEFDEADVDIEVLDLLKRLLIKNAEDRITLEEIKRHPFILRTIPDPEKWIEETDPRHVGDKLEVTAEEVNAAVSLTERVKRTLYKIQSSLSGLTGLRRRATTAKSTGTSLSSKRSASVSTIEPSSPDGRTTDSPRQGSQVSVDSMERISSGTSSTRPSPPQSLSRKPSTTTCPPPLPAQSEHPVPLRPSRSVHPSSRHRPSEFRDSSAPCMPRSRAISNLSRGLNGDGADYLEDDYSNGLYFSDDQLSHGSSYVDASEKEDEGHLLIDFGRRRRSRLEAENLAKQLEASKLDAKIDEETASLASSRGTVKHKKDS
jgi:serine/threonine protein kinase